MTVDRFVESFRSLVLDYGMQIVGTVCIGIIIVISKKVVNRFCSRSVTKGLIPNRLGNFLQLLMNVVALFLFVVCTTTVWGVEGTWVIGTFGLSAGTVVGFASSETIGSAVAGFVILLSRPFEVGHRIKINDHLGDVKKIDLIYTTIVTPNLEEINVPNRNVLTGEIVNYGMYRPIRIPVSCTVDYGVNLDEVKENLLRIPDEVEGVLTNPKPFVRVSNLGDFAVELMLYVYTLDSANIFHLEAELREGIWRMAQIAGISLATPHLIQSTPAPTDDTQAFGRDLDLEKGLVEFRVREKTPELA